MPIDEAAIDRAALALLYLTLHDGDRAWKAICWDVMDRLHAQGFIDNPVNRGKSVVFTPEGLARARELFAQQFGTDGPEDGK
ncbi:DUF6429 family protein [Xylophilus sp.]|uniref:DUF6429 family protein n=1 Tax=Xylophilus sp. TaxID=2653893 RepID=UPI0013BB5450|nr:DUF6429 family protein [Xylophilus sp.]KAF1050020.1 MAG: hypothetical protein GAK38_00044 [Xylophilus sp.]